jgi:hypothetical protein
MFKFIDEELGQQMEDHLQEPKEGCSNDFEAY